MANYYATCRSNYFRVKNPGAFVNEMERIGVIVAQGDATHFCVIADDPDGGGWPSYIYDGDNDEDIEIDFFKIVASHLIDDDEVAIFMEAGAEKARYVIGHAFAINGAGDFRVVNLRDIYSLAEELTHRPSEITEAEY